MSNNKLGLIQWLTPLVTRTAYEDGGKSLNAVRPGCTVEISCEEYPLVGFSHYGDGRVYVLCEDERGWNGNDHNAEWSDFASLDPDKTYWFTSDLYCSSGKSGVTDCLMT